VILPFVPPADFLFVCLFLFFVCVFLLLFCYAQIKFFSQSNHAFLCFIGGLGESTLLSWFKPFSGEGECYVSPQRDICFWRNV
jgi:hypothetical protein